MKEQLVVETAGHGLPYLSFRPWSACGDITDGVSLAHWSDKKFNGRSCEGSWVISFKDLEKMYLLAKERRSSNGCEVPK